LDFIRTAGNNKLADTLIKYDDPAYPCLPYGAFSLDHPGHHARGNATTARHWLNTTSFLYRHRGQFDQFGNLRYAWDGKGQSEPDRNTLQAKLRLSDEDHYAGS